MLITVTGIWISDFASNSENFIQRIHTVDDELFFLFKIIHHDSRLKECGY